MHVNGEEWCRESVTKHTGEQETPTHSHGLSNTLPQL